MAKSQKIIVKGSEISVLHIEKEDYISLTDIARHKDEVHTDDIIKNWLRNRNTIELLGFWEQLYNPDFKPVEFDGFKNEAGRFDRLNDRELTQHNDRELTQHNDRGKPVAELVEASGLKGIE